MKTRGSRVGSVQIRRHGENSHRLHRAIVAAGGLTDQTTLVAWGEVGRFRRRLQA